MLFADGVSYNLLQVFGHYYSKQTFAQLHFHPPLLTRPSGVAISHLEAIAHQVMQDSLAPAGILFGSVSVSSVLSQLASTSIIRT